MAADSPSVRRSRGRCRRQIDSREAEEATPAILEMLAVPAVLETLATPVTPETAGPLAVPVHWYNPVAEGNPANQADPAPRCCPAVPALVLLLIGGLVWRLRRRRAPAPHAEATA